MDPEVPAEFDLYAHAYDTLLEKALRIAGEGKDYFARGRLLWLKRCLDELRTNPKSILDFGCGTGSATPIFLETFRPEQFLGLDDSAALLDIARKEFADPRARFLRPSEYRERGSLDLVFCSAVFHHIKAEDQAAVARRIHSYLKPGGLFALWEHNAWSPAARYVMSRCEFDKDAVPLSSGQARAILLQAGFEILRTDYRFIFPKALRRLRGMEDFLAKAPLGAQFQILCRRSS